MGLFNMSPMDLITKVMDFSQQSLENTTGTIKEVHQTLVDIPVNIAEELGVPKEQTAAFKAAHRRILDHVEKGVCDACGEVNQYIVKQAVAVNQLADFNSKTTEPSVVMLEDLQDRRQDKKAG